VTRGGSVMTVPRLKHPKARSLAGPEHDAAFVGFRSCAPWHIATPWPRFP